MGSCTSNEGEAPDPRDKLQRPEGPPVDPEGILALGRSLSFQSPTMNDIENRPCASLDGCLEKLSSLAEYSTKPLRQHLHNFYSFVAYEGSVTPLARPCENLEDRYTTFLGSDFIKDKKKLCGIKKEEFNLVLEKPFERRILYTRALFTRAQPEQTHEEKEKIELLNDCKVKLADILYSDLNLDEDSDSYSVFTQFKSAGVKNIEITLYLQVFEHGFLSDETHVRSVARQMVDSQVTDKDLLDVFISGARKMYVSWWFKSMYLALRSYDDENVSPLEIRQHRGNCDDNVNDDLVKSGVLLMRFIESSHAIKRLFLIGMYGYTAYFLGNKNKKSSVLLGKPIFGPNPEWKGYTRSEGRRPECKLYLADDIENVFKVESNWGPQYEFIQKTFIDSGFASRFMLFDNRDFAEEIEYGDNLAGLMHDCLWYGLIIGLYLLAPLTLGITAGVAVVAEQVLLPTSRALLMQ